jgi:branched-chain amino acid transport system substrate-binding protein
MKSALKLVAAAAVVLCAQSAMAQKGETVKIGWIDPLTGLMGPVGSNQLKSFQFFAEKFSQSNPAGVKFEVVGMDNKLSPTESLNALKSAIDQGVRYIAQGNGSSVAGALVDAVNKHNERNPGKEIIFLALPLRCRHLHENGSTDHLHDRQKGHQEGLPDQPELLPRSASGALRQRDVGPQAL